MYEQFYGFSTLPFAARPAAGEYYFSEQQRRVLESLEERLAQGGCVCALSGAEGVGKTTLVQALCDAVKDKVDIYNVDAAQTSGETSLAQKVVAVLGIEADCDRPASLDRCLEAELSRWAEAGQKGLLVIENAADISVSDSQMLHTLMAGSKLMILLVADQSESEPVAGETLFAGFAGNIAQCYTLLPFNPVETDTYIRVRLIQAGATPDLFAPSAVEAVYRYSLGLPRLINRICDLALVYGFSRQHEQIDQQTMDFVLNDRWGRGQQQTNAPVDSGAGLSALSGDTEHTAVNVPQSHVEVAADGVPLQQARSRQAGAAFSQTGPSSQADSVIARQLVELLRQGEQYKINSDQPSERDIYDFIRLSMQYHQRHLERFTLGVAAGVVLLAVGGVWAFMAWQNSNHPASGLASKQIADESFPGSTVRWERPPPVRDVVMGEPIPSLKMHAGVVRALRPLDSQMRSGEEIPAAEQAALESPGTIAKTMPDPTPAAQQKELTASIATQNHALQAERKKLEQERLRLKKKLAAQRAENERLERESRREQERTRKAQSLVEEARKNAHLSWDKANTSTPDAFPED